MVRLLCEAQGIAKQAGKGCGLFQNPSPGRALGCRVRSGHQGTLYITVSTGTVHERGSKN